ncbi:MAG: FAD-dependent oxidoreductase, partial [Pseudomonadota bacterium]
MNQSDSRKIVIVGGGVIGLAVAYHLGAQGESDVLLLERQQLTSGTSWHAAGIVGPLRASVNMTRIAHYATQLFPDLERETGQATGYKQTGGYWFAREADRLHELHRIAAIGELTGVEAEIISPRELASREPYLHTDDLAGALYVPSDAQANPVDICMAYAKAAREKGIELRESAEVIDFEIAAGAINAVILSCGERIGCDKLVLCTGAWSHRLSTKLGVPMPLQAVEHMYVVTEPVDNIPDPYPVMRDLDAGTYIKGDAGKLVIGGFEPNAKPWDAYGPDGDRPFLELPEDWDQFEPFMNAALERVPLLENVGIQHFMNGPESFTPDSRQSIGESPFVKNVFVAAGMNSTGMMSSAGLGRALAEWLIGGEAPFDLWEIDVARFGTADADTAYLRERMRESVADVFGMHWPHKQAVAGRGLRQSSLHQSFAQQSAFFGVTAGWERPFWFAQTANEKHIHYSYAEQSWWPAAERECAALRDKVAILDLSPFGKFDLRGDDALPLLQQLCTSNMDIPAGNCVYTQMLNDRGGIEADITVARFATDHFRITSGAATRFRDWQWLRRQCDCAKLDVQIDDVTESEAVLGVAGPDSRALLQSASTTDFSNGSFPFSTTRKIEIDGTELRATRVSFSGELGWELHIDAADAPKVMDHLVDAGDAFELQFAGHLALLACSIEKGFRHWGHEMGPDETPLEAGLGFTIDWDKPEGFIGLDALREQRSRGLDKHLLMFEVSGTHPVLTHDEPIRCEGELVGSTTSGARGFRTGKTL